MATFYRRNRAISKLLSKNISSFFEFASGHVFILTLQEKYINYIEKENVIEELVYETRKVNLSDRQTINGKENILENQQERK